MAEPFDLSISSAAPSRDDASRRNISRSEPSTLPVTPPTRYISSTYSTPGSTFGQEQDAVVIELCTRYLKAGVEGESHPQCRWDLKPSASKRIDDYRQYLPNYIRPKDDLEQWGEGYEFWRNDINGVDLGILSDILERALREVNDKHLLVDAANSRLVLVVPSLLPHPVLATILQTMFERWVYPSITLLPRPAMALVAAGLRSGLVVDIDWEETIVTVVYEYREVKSLRTIRAMKLVTKSTADLIKQSLLAADRFDLELIEEVLGKVGRDVCQNEVIEVMRDDDIARDDLLIDWPTDAFSRPLRLSRQELRTSILNAILGKDDEKYYDEDELPIQNVMYDVLRAVSPEVRGMCVSRIVFTGAGSENHNLVSRILDSFKELVRSRAWTEVQGVDLQHLQKYRASQTKQPGPIEVSQPVFESGEDEDSQSPKAERMLDAERHLRDRSRNQPSVIHGVVRQVETMGPWTGASLITTLRVKSFVEVQRDKFLHHGMASAVRELDSSSIQQQGRVPAVGRSKAGERTSWTLSGWA